MLESLFRSYILGFFFKYDKLCVFVRETILIAFFFPSMTHRIYLVCFPFREFLSVPHLPWELCPNKILCFFFYALGFFHNLSLLLLLKGSTLLPLQTDVCYTCKINFFHFNIKQLLLNGVVATFLSNWLEKLERGYLVEKVINQVF